MYFVKTKQCHISIKASKSRHGTKTFQLASENPPQRKQEYLWGAWDDMQLCLLGFFLTVSCTWSVCLSPLVSLDLRELRVESRERRVSEGRERRVSECREPEPLDGLEQLYRALEQANVTALGDPRPCSRQELRRCFIQRARDPLLNDRLHRVRALRSTLKVSLTTSVTNGTKI